MQLCSRSRTGLLRVDRQVPDVQKKSAGIGVGAAQGIFASCVRITSKGRTGSRTRKGEEAIIRQNLVQKPLCLLLQVRGRVFDDLLRLGTGVTSPRLEIPPHRITGGARAGCRRIEIHVQAKEVTTTRVAAGAFIASRSYGRSAGAFVATRSCVHSTSRRSAKRL